jgi:chemosensory pili system protein ChpA (sensor histidine kinase/response regulator)
MLGDGEVVAVLDLGAMLQSQADPERRFRPGIAATPVDEEVSLPRVLIVDDSLSVRNSLAQLMSDSGYQPVLARDGLEAINMIETETPDIVLTDLEMPRMNGLDLTSYVRNSDTWNELPVVMITSRNMAKHRQQADRVGVNRYLTKPFTDDEILECIDAELSSPA